MIVTPLRQAADAFTERTPEGLVVMASSGQVYRFNGLAEFVWSRCDGAHTVESLVDAIEAEYAIPSREQVWEDISRFTAFLREQNLLAE